MSTHEHTPDELVRALRLIRSECRAHPESCTECPLSFNDGGPILQCGITEMNQVLIRKIVGHTASNVTEMTYTHA